ncbi:hypothetical protein BJV78DRAFT_854805 [Lactifluus subvellereus]|nr:hypothetical protein BJV78DRAFT_854805 [Lactifluus subvellereus]
MLFESSFPKLFTMSGCRVLTGYSNDPLSAQSRVRLLPSCRLCHCNGRSLQYLSLFPLLWSIPRSFQSQRATSHLHGIGSEKAVASSLSGKTQRARVPSSLQLDSPTICLPAKPLAVLINEKVGFKKISRGHEAHAYTMPTPKPRDASSPQMSLTPQPRL